MRLLAIADIHGATDVYEWLRDAVSDNDADVLILAGDLLLGAWEEEQSKQAYTFVLPLLYSIPIPVFFIMGNDDHVEPESRKEMIRSVHGRRLDMSVYNIAGYQYSPPFVGSCHEKPEDEIAADLKKMVPLIDENTVVVTHTPAYGYVDQTCSGDHVGSRALSNWLNRKNVLCHIHGHVHHSFGRSGNHFNVAADGKPRAMIIDLPSLSYSVIEK